MTRSRSALLAAVGAAALLAGCGGGDASQSEVRDEVEELLVENGYAGEEVAPEQAAEIAVCVSQRLFESADFTKEERNDIANASDGDRPSEDLANRVQALVDDCAEGAEGAG